jgi:hypothetical protein
MALGTKRVDSFICSTTVAPGLGGTCGDIRDIAAYEGTAANPAPAGYAGDIFVVDRTNNRIQRLGSNGAFELAFGRDVIAATATTNTDLGDVFERCTVAADCKVGSIGTSTDGPAGELSSPQGVAVNQQTGNVYVWDRSNRRVQQFDRDGNFIRMWGGDVISSGANNNGTAPEVCDTTAGNVEADCKQGTSGTANGQFGFTGSSGNNGIAISPSTGDVVVVDPVNRRAQQFTAAGTFVRLIGSSSNFSSNQPSHIAIDASGIVYASNGGQVLRYDSNISGFHPPITAPTGLPSSTHSIVNGLEVDRVTGNLLVAKGGTAATFTGVYEFDLPADPAAPVDDSTIVDRHQPDGGFLPQGLGIDSAAGRLYLSTSTGGNRIVVLDDDGAPPAIVTISPPSDVGFDSAMLAGTVNPNGVGLNTTYRFETSKDGVVWTPVAPDASIGDGTAPISVDDLVENLDANTTYRLRIVATKELGGGTTISPEATFVTDAPAPEAETLPATARRATSIMLQTRINPNGSPTTYRFEYGTTTGYGQSAPIPDANAGAGGSDRFISQAVTGLQSATTYHYRVVAESPVGVTIGADRTFTTRAAGTPSAGRAYELVSPRVKQTGPGLGGHGNQSQLDGEMRLYSGLASPDGERFVSPTLSGPVLVEGASVFVDNYALGERHEGGWDNRSLANRRNYAASPATPFLDFNTSNRDLSLMALRNGGGAAYLFADMASFPGGLLPSYLRDWVGSWEVLQPFGPGQGTPSADSLVALNSAGTVAALSTDRRGMLGAGDASLDQVPGTWTTYLHDVSAGLSDTYPGGGVRSLLGVCTGDDVVETRTEIPSVNGSGDLVPMPCPPAAAGRDDALTSSGGASLSPSVGASPLDDIMSTDGSRVFFMSPDPRDSASLESCTSATGTATKCPPQLFVRQHDPAGDPVVRWISRPEVADQDASLLGPAYFEGASADGDKVFFRTTTPLTADDPNGGATVPGGATTGTASQSSWDLYMYDFPDNPAADPGSGALTRISAGPTGAADANLGGTGKVQGALRFVADDGRKLYFTTAAPLPGVGDPSDGTITVPSGTPATTAALNLYLYDASAAVPERWRFVARLPRGAVNELAACASTANGSGQPRQTLDNAHGFLYTLDVSRNCVRGTSDGSFITLWTDGRLVADDPDVTSGDVYGFDAAANELTRLSGPQGGAGGSYLCDNGDNGDRNVRCFGDGGFRFTPSGGSRVPGLLGVATEPDVAGDRVAFFQSRSRLVPEDIDDAMDVYEWRNGELSLLSSGNSSEGAFYSGNGSSGRDVFAITRDRWTWDDIDAVRDAYDARVGGGFDQPSPPAVCAVLAGGCQGASGPIAQPPVGSDGAQSGGNVPASRVTLDLAQPSAKARRRAALTGVLAVVVNTSSKGRVKALARARLGGRSRVVGRGSKVARKAGSVRILVRLSRSARMRLRGGKRLHLSVVVSQKGGRAEDVSVGLKGVAR